MGGIGSGNWYRWDKRDAVEDYRSLDVRRWQRDGLLEPGRWFSWQWTRDGQTLASIGVTAGADRVILNHRHRSGGGEWKAEEYPVRLDRTPCTYGGTRGWFKSARGIRILKALFSVICHHTTLPQTHY